MPHILVVKTSSMGDLVHTLPMVTDIVRHVADARIDWVVEEAFADIPRLHPAVRDLIPVAVRRWRKQPFARAVWREIGLMRAALRTRRYDYIIDAQGLIKSALIARLAHGPVFGRDRASVREPLATLAYAQSFAVPKGRHAVWRNRLLAARIFGYELDAQPIDYGAAIPHDVAVPALPKPYITLVHGCSDPRRWWPIAHWHALGALCARAGYTPVLPWGNAAEEANAHAIAAKLPGARVLPRLALRAHARLLADAHAVVGVDTGLTHLATGLRLPTVTIFRFTPPHLSGAQGPLTPWGRNAGDTGRIATVAEVTAALAELNVALPAPAARTDSPA